MKGGRDECRDQPTEMVVVRNVAMSVTIRFMVRNVVKGVVT